MKVEKTVNGQPLGFKGYVDKYLWNELREFPHLLSSNYDVFGLVFGLEGAGKSELALSIGAFTDQDFDIENVVFTPESFKEAVIELPKGSTIVWDEADEVSDHHASKKFKMLKKFAKRMRKENKTCILVQPVLFDQNRYWVMHRSRYGIRVYDKPEKRKASEQRGFMEFYGPKKLKRFYIDGKKDYWNQNNGSPNWKGRFYRNTHRKGFPVPIGFGSAYDKKKGEATSKLKKESAEPKKLGNFTPSDVLLMVNNLSIPKTKLAEKIGVSEKTLYRRIKKLRSMKKDD